jgi:hypothetical protein
MWMESQGYTQKKGRHGDQVWVSPSNKRGKRVPTYQDYTRLATVEQPSMTPQQAVTDVGNTIGGIAGGYDQTNQALQSLLQRWF